MSNNNWQVKKKGNRIAWERYLPEIFIMAVFLFLHIFSYSEKSL